jgi:uncharacterized protein Smg (DUF494 family)
MAEISIFKASNGSGVRNNVPESHTHFVEYIQDIKDGIFYTEVMAYRNAKTEETKRRLTAVTPSGKFKKQGKDGLETHSGIICIDIDAKDNEGVDVLAIRQDEYLYALHQSTGGQGFAAYYRIEGDRHLDAFYALEKRLADKFHIIVDPACKDVSRLRFVSFDPNAYIANKQVPLFKTYLPKAKAAPVPKFYPHGEHDVEHILQQIEAKRIDLTDSYADWVKIGFAIASKYQDLGADLFHRVSRMSPKYNPESCDRKYKQLCQSKQNQVSFASFMWLAKNAGIEIQTKQTKHIVSTAKSHRMRVGTNGGPKDINAATEAAVRVLREIDNIDIDGLEEIVANTMALDTTELKSADTEDTPIKQIKAFLRSFDLKRNSVTRCIELRGQPITDVDLNNIYIDCLEAFGKKEVSMQLVGAIVDSDFTPTYNPFMQFFAKHGHRTPKGCIEALTNTIKASNQEHAFIQLCIVKWLCSVVASMHGQYSLSILVLCGDQGIGKTNFFRYLLPEELRPYYGESKLDAGKDDEILMCKKIILCDDEFGGKSKQEAKKLKELSSKQTFSIRKPYGRVHEELTRYAVLCGTSNDEEVINDPTGNRRILPVVISEIDWDAYAAIDKTDLFIEAFHAYKELGADSWQLSKAEITMLNNHTQHNVQPAVEKEMLLNMFTIPKDNDDPYGKWLSNTEIKNIIETHTKQHISSHKLGAVLKSLGCKKVTRRDRDFLPCYFLVRNSDKSDYAQKIDNKQYPF